MPDTTAELGLNLAKDTDDAADYEVVYLRNSLTTLDGLFSQVSGHTHSGAHQGGPINGNAFNGALDIPDWFRSTGRRSAFATAGAGIELYWDGVNGILNSYDRAASQWRPMVIRGNPITIGMSGHDLQIDGSGNLTLPGTLTGGALHLTGSAQVDGSLTVNGASTINNNLSIVGGSLYISNGGARIDTPGGDTIRIVNNAQTVLDLSVGRNLSVAGTGSVTGALSSGTHTVSGDVNASGKLSTLNNPSNVAPYTVGGTPEHIEHGHPSCNGVGAGSYGTYAQTFSRAFSGNPIVILTIDTPTSGDIKDWHVAAQNVSMTGFNIRIHNATGSGGNCTVSWFAIGV